MLCIMSTLFMLTNIHGCFITAAVILRMTKRGNGRPYCGESQAIKKHWRGILALTVFTTFYRIIHILANQLICPLCGAFVLPPLIARISRYRKHVGLQVRESSRAIPPASAWTGGLTHPASACPCGLVM